MKQRCYCDGHFVDRCKEVERIYSVRVYIILKSNVYCKFFFLNSLGVKPVCFLKSVLKEDLELNPTS